MISEHSMADRMRGIWRSNSRAANEKVVDPITQPVERPTTRISRAELELFPIHHHTPFGLRIGAAHLYKAVPQKKAQQGQGLIWRIELHGLTPNCEALGFDIMGDVTLGRSADGQNPVDIALDAFGAAAQGVSRVHAMLRPTRNCLYLLDLDSLNGTFYNAMRLGPGVVHSVKNDDTITLGNFSFTIHIIDCPSMH